MYRIALSTHGWVGEKCNGFWLCKNGFLMKCDEKMNEREKEEEEED